jgi:hypothetical protein
MRVVHGLEIKALFIALKVGVGDELFDRCQGEKTRFNERKEYLWVVRDRPSRSFLRVPASASFASSMVVRWWQGGG